MVKTYKRETAFALLIMLFVLCWFDIFTGGNTKAFAWAEMLVTPIFAFVAIAFGADAALKQWPRRNQQPPEEWGER
ncbi:putative membrane protein [Labrenzia sp. EL_208]|nr:putative membrane protein [Labrenzia sp. EL_132]MBG6233358.1 putative membrane protein [Labrenzia sp. EL_208]